MRKEIRGAAMSRTCSLSCWPLHFGVTLTQVTEAEPDHNNDVTFCFRRKKLISCSASAELL